MLDAIFEIWGWGLALPFLWSYLIPNTAAQTSNSFAIGFFVIPIAAAIFTYIISKPKIDSHKEWSSIAVVHIVSMLTTPFVGLYYLNNPNPQSESIFPEFGGVIGSIIIAIIVAYLGTWLLAKALNGILNNKRAQMRRIAEEKEREIARKRQEEADKQYAEWKRENDIRMAEEERKQKIAQAEEEKRITQQDNDIHERIAKERINAERRMVKSPLVHEIAECILPYYKGLIDQADRQSHMKTRVRLMIKVFKDSIMYCNPSDVNGGKVFLFEEEGIAEKLSPILREALCKTLIAELRRLLFEAYPSDASGQKVQIGLEQEVLIVSNKVYIRGKIDTCPEYDDEAYAYAVMEYQTFESKGERYF